MIIYDYGMTLGLPHELSAKFTDFLVGFVLNDENRIVQALIDLDIVDKETDRAFLNHSIRGLLEEIWGRPLTQQLISEIAQEIFKVVRLHQMRIPAEGVLVIQAASTLETIAKTLDPKYDFTYSMGPYIISVLQAEYRDGSLLNAITDVISRLPTISKRVIEPELQVLLSSLNLSVNDQKRILTLMAGFSASVAFTFTLGSFAHELTRVSLPVLILIVSLFYSSGRK